MTWFDKRIRAMATKQIALALLVLAGLAAWAVSETRYLKNYFSGPIAMANADLVKVTDPSKLERYWITTQPDEVIDTKSDHITTTRRRRGGTSTSVTGHYYIFRYGNRLAIAEAEPGLTPSGTIEASVVPVEATLFSATTKPEVKARFLPVMLQTKSFSDDGNWALTIGGGLALAALAFAGRALMQRGNPQRHPAIAALVSRPGFSLAAAGASVEADIAAKTTVKAKGHLLSSQFFLKPSGLSFAAKPFDDLVWAYHEVTKKKIYWVIPAGSSHAAVMQFKDGPVSMPIGKTQADAILQHIAAAAPWAITGHNPEIASAFATRKQDVIAYVDQRRAEISGSSTATT